jgi:hypothetical protein
VKILLQDFEKIKEIRSFKPAVKNGILNERINDSSSVSVVKLPQLIVKITIFPHRNRHKSSALTGTSQSD